ncbi:MAG: hypothetical protein WD059_08985 [Balneolaceae bacterium]
MNKASIKQKIKDFSESELAAKLGKILNRIIQVGIIVYLAFELTELGWSKFFKSLPVNPLFYLIFLINYFLLPVSEIFSYGISWKIKVKESFSVFIKKRVYNKDVLGYSGEVQLFAWARKKLGKSDKEIFKVIRDNNILSSVASTTIAFFLLLIFFATDQISLFDYLKRENLFTYIAMGIIVIIIGVVLYRFRRYFFSMSRKVALSVLGIHTTRFMLVNILQVVQWYVVMPEIPLRIWFTYLSMTLILSRIPFLPNKDLVFIGASIEISKLINVSTAGIAGLFIAQNVLDKLLNAILFTTLTAKEPAIVTEQDIQDLESKSRTS